MSRDSILGWFRILLPLTLIWILSATTDVDGLWHEFGESQYLIMEEPTAVLDDARETCQSYGGDLAVIKTTEINTFLKDRIRTQFDPNNPYFCYWIGLQRSGWGNFTWLDGTTLEYHDWYTATEPNDMNSWGCLGVRDGPSWYDRGQQTYVPYICERTRDVDGLWYEFGESQYLIMEEPTAVLDDARETCQSYGGDLAVIKTTEINTFLKDRIRTQFDPNNPYFCYWIGLQRSGWGNFTWLDGTTLEYHDWYTATEPNDVNSWGCLGVRDGPSWYDRGQQTSVPYICERTRGLRPILPVRLMAATSSPYGGGLLDASFICLLGSENEQILTFSNRRLVRLTEAITADSYTAPGNSDDVSSVVLRQTLPATMEGLGFFECSSVTASRMTSVPLGILLSTRELQPSDGRFTKTIHIGHDITLSVMSTTGLVGEDGIRWRKFTDEDWANQLIGMSSGSLSHTIQSASVSDAGVYVTYMDGTLEQHQFSLIRLIVKECPYGRWSPPLCDRLCDNCYNGGVCHELSGTCICPPGHAGKNCLQACGKQTFGWDCEFECGPSQPLDKCAGSQICQPDPYGCNCLAGYTGVYCNETCLVGMHGADCLQECHCTDGADCDDFTGECPRDCSQGWSGPACQVPSVCLNGYFGSNCTQKCNCMNGTACRKDSGYCDEVEGRCDLGYVTDSVEFPANCMIFSGCFSSCSKTCHCSGGTGDCNFLTGDCLSSTCHPRWMGDQCQTDRFVTSLEKTNPGVAIFSCSFTASSGQNLPSEYVKAAVGRPFTEPWISLITSDTSGPTLNNSFIHEYTGPEEPIYCFIGLPEDSSEFAFVRLPPRDLFVLPGFNGVPEILAIGYYHAAIGWRQWDSSSDTGDGPIVGYKIYVRSGSNVILAKEVQPPSMVNNTDRSVSKRSAANATEMVMYNISGLEAGSTYSVQIAAIRDGINGEGEQGAALTFTTKQVPKPSSSPTVSSPSTSNSAGVPSGSIATVVGSTVSSPSKSTSVGGSSDSTSTIVGSAVGAIVVIVIVIIIVIIFYKRRSDESATTKSKGKESDSSPQYENPVFDQSQTDVHTYQDLHTDTNTYQDRNQNAQSYDDAADPHTYQELHHEANYEELTDVMDRDYVNVPGI